MAARTLFFLAMLVAALLSQPADAVNRTWVGANNGTFGTSTNWNPNGAPAAADSLLIDAGTVPSTYNINLAADATVTQLTVATSPLVLAGPTRTLSLTGTADDTLLIGRTGSGAISATLTSSLAQLNTTYARFGADAGTSGTLNVMAGTFSVSGKSAFGDLAIGDLGTGTLNVSNGADVTVSGETALAVFGGSAGNLTITGSGSTLTSNDRLWVGKGTGTINVAGGGSLTVNSRLDLYTGKLTGNGDVITSVANSAGLVAPSSLVSGFGSLHITGFYTQTNNGKLQIELAGTTADTQYDRLNVTGTVNLGGTLQVTLSSFAPAQNNVFDILDFTNRFGTFATVDLPQLTGSLEWDTSKLYVDGTIRVVLPGDFNNSGAVDAADFAAWRKGLGTTYTASDYDTWRTRFGRSATGAGSGLDAAASVPEPTSMLLVSVATLFATCSPARTRRQG